jgi:flavin reductase (DIM6/NTAB) family NADH-FMN oxidoreductase RutF
LKGAPTAFDCTIEEMLPRATHSILIGRVRAMRSTPGAGALVYWHGAYRCLEDDPTSP